MKLNPNITIEDASEAFDRTLIIKQNAIAEAAAKATEMSDAHARWVAINHDAMVAKVAAKAAWNAHKAAQKAVAKAKADFSVASDNLTIAITPALKARLAKAKADAAK